MVFHHKGFWHLASIAPVCTHIKADVQSLTCIASSEGYIIFFLTLLDKINKSGVHGIAWVSGMRDVSGVADARKV